MKVSLYSAHIFESIPYNFAPPINYNIRFFRWQIIYNIIKPLVPE